MAQAQFLNSPPPKRIKDAKKDEEYERTQLLVVWTEEREKEVGKREKGLVSCQLLFFIGLKVKTELTTTNSPPHSFALSSLLFFFSPFPGWFEGPVIHSYPCSFLGSSSAKCFLFLRQPAHNIFLFI